MINQPLKQLPENEQAAGGASPVVELRGLRKYYIEGGRERVVLDSVDYTSVSYTHLTLPTSDLV